MQNAVQGQKPNNCCALWDRLSRPLIQTLWIKHGAGSPETWKSDPYTICTTCDRRDLDFYKIKQQRTQPNQILTSVFIDCRNSTIFCFCINIHWHKLIISNHLGLAMHYNGPHSSIWLSHIPWSFRSYGASSQYYYLLGLWGAGVIFSFLPKP